MSRKEKDIVTIYCNCSYYNFISEKTRKSIFKALTACDFKFEAVSDLCLLAAKRDPIFKKWEKSEKIRIIACFPRAIRWLFHYGDFQLPPNNVEYFNMRTETPENIIAGLHCSPASDKENTETSFSKDSEWIPWFPVIDYDRCKNCKQCMNFCLFGTYELSETGKVEVKNPSNCKTNCPACARVCPDQAIIFPKYDDPPINGDEISKQLSCESKTSALSESLKGNVYDVIKQRNKRFAIDSKDEVNPSTTPSIENLKNELKIPNEVLSSLSPADILKIRAKSRKDNS